MIGLLDSQESLPLVPITADLFKSCRTSGCGMGASSYGPKTVDGHASRTRRDAASILPGRPSLPWQLRMWSESFLSPGSTAGAESAPPANTRRALPRPVAHCRCPPCADRRRRADQIQQRHVRRHRVDNVTEHSVRSPWSPMRHPLHSRTTSLELSGAAHASD